MLILSLDSVTSVFILGRAGIVSMTVFLLDSAIFAMNNQFASSSLTYGAANLYGFGFCLCMNTYSLCAVTFYIPTALG